MSYASDALIDAQKRDIKQLKAENAKLRDENARLLSCLTDDAENARQILGESRALEAENDRLRELVGVLMHCMQLHKECDECRLNGSKSEVALDPLCACDGLHELLRELGVEVDG